MNISGHNNFLWGILNDDILTLTSFSNLPEILHKLHDAKFSLGILTSNSFENVSAWLKLNKIDHIFNFVHAEASYFGKSRIINTLLKKHKATKAHAFYIGDETRDIDAAKKSGIGSIAVTWGFNSERILVRHRPDYVVRKPEDLLNVW